MTPDERQLISGLFDRMRQAGNQPRDRAAEALIADQVRNQPYAPYLLAQTVIVQEQALRAANDKILQLEAEARKYEAPPQEETSFLGGLGKSIFGGGPSNQPRQAVPTTGGFGPAPLPQEPGPFRGQGNPGASTGPWGGGGAAAPAAGSSSFLKGALGAAAGVAGGVLLADGIRDLFSGGHNAFGIGSGFGGGMGGFGNPGGGETIINNYYENPEPGQDSADLGGQGTDFGDDSFDPGSYGSDNF